MIVLEEHTTMTARFIPYYRVSTKRQGKSGLGLEAQQVDVLKLIAERNGSEIAHYTEIETGKNPDRPELAKAIAHAKLSNATLVVAKLDRLARNVAFTAALMESKVDFVCCDCKGANTLTLHILAAVAQEEARLIGERTRKALAAAKARGVKLGSAREGAWAGPRAPARLQEGHAAVGRETPGRDRQEVCPPGPQAEGTAGRGRTLDRDRPVAQR